MGVTASRRWIVDDGPLDVLVRAVSPAELATWPPGELVVMSKTAQDAWQPRKPSAAADRRREFLDVHAADGTAVIEVVPVPMGSDVASMVWEHLRRDCDGTSNLAEHEAIAWAYTRAPDAVLVLMDVRAGLLGLAELGCGRVAHAFDLWLHLLESGRVTHAQFERLCEDTRKRDQRLPALPKRVEERLGPAPA